MGFSSFLLALVAACLAAQVGAIPTIEAIGSKFFTSEGQQYFIKGIAYQLIEDDPLVNVTQCRLDASLMKELGANTIRVYHVDATADHTGCMAAFADAGIYLFVDLDSFDTYIPTAGIPSWTKAKSDSYRAVMDNFAQFDNTAGFFIGNENLNSLEDARIAPYLLAAAVDLKAYRTARGYRRIPLGYSATDTGALPMLQDYLVCRPNETERLEFYALNSYRWCGASSYDAAYSGLQAAAKGYPVPIWFSEVGCNTAPEGRLFTDQVAIFSPPMVGTWSGSMVYEWIQEVNRYGLISYGPTLPMSVQVGKEIIQGITRQGVPTPVQPDFQNLQSQWSKITPSGVRREAYTRDMSTISRSCPASSATGWTVDPNSPLPTLGQSALVGVTQAPSVSRSTGFASTTTSSTGTTSATNAPTNAGRRSVNPVTSFRVSDTTITGVSALLGLSLTCIMMLL